MTVPLAESFDHDDASDIPLVHLQHHDNHPATDDDTSTPTSTSTPPATIAPALSGDPQSDLRVPAPFQSASLEK